MKWGSAVLGALLAASVTAPSNARGSSQTCFGRAATIVGTDGPDELVGTRGPDVIVARRETRQDHIECCD